jgi:hypothetical protein
MRRCRWASDDWAPRTACGGGWAPPGTVP